MVTKKYFRWASIVITAILINGCGKGMDSKPNLSSIEKYRAQIAEDFKEVSQEKAEAYSWAVSDQSLETLKTNYSGKSYLQIAKAEIEREITTAKSEIPKLEKATSEFDPVITELRKIKVEVSNAGPSNDMGREFAYTAHITNGSRFDFSSLNWDSALYLNGATEAAATGTNISFFEDKGGLKAGQSVDERMTEDTFFKKDWDTLTVKNAKERKVVLTLRDAKDFSNKSFLDGAPYARLNKLKSILVTAEKYNTTLAN